VKLEQVAIVIGHDWTSKGAYSSYIGQSEYTYNLEVANMVGCDVFTHKPNYSYRQKMKSTYNKLSHYDLTIELHFNAANQYANGAEALYFHKNEKGRIAAMKYATMVSDHYGTINRGDKPLSNSNQRGFWAVASGIPTAILVEPFFGSHSEANKFKDKCEYAGVLRRFIQEYQTW